MTNSCGIYQIKNVVTGDYYIGSSNNLRQRICRHRRFLANNKHENKHLQHAYNKYGKESFEFKVLLLCDVECKLSIEQGFLDLFKPAYNIATNAAAAWQGLHHTEETKQKMSEAAKGSAYALGHKQTEDHKRKISESQKGELGNMFGKHHTAESKRKISEAQKGALNHNFGKHPSEETRAKMRNAQKMRWMKAAA